MDAVYISYELFTEIVNTLDQVAHFLESEKDKAPCPTLINLISEYKKLEEYHSVNASKARGEKAQECISLIERLFDETADQIQYIAL